MCKETNATQIPELLQSALNLAEEHYWLVNKAEKYYNDLDYRLQNILDNYLKNPSLTHRQANWLENELAKFTEIKPLYGDFKAVQVMFTIASNHLKRPKIRLLTKENTFIQLTFIPGEKTIILHRGGWAGHGQRVYLGKITPENQIIPKFSGAITEDIENCLQEFSLNPAAVAKASALKLGACGFCGQRLTDQESKSKGYGPICADHFGLPWGKTNEAAIARRNKTAQADDLSSLFA